MKSPAKCASCLQQLSWMPAGIAKTVLEGGLAVGRAMAGPTGLLAPWREGLLRELFASGQSLRLQFPAEDLGFCYSEAGAAVAAPADSTLSQAGVGA